MFLKHRKNNMEEKYAIAIWSIRKFIGLIALQKSFKHFRNACFNAISNILKSSLCEWNKNIDKFLKESSNSKKFKPHTTRK